MKLYLDSAELPSVCEYLDWYPLDGVTSNPSILKKSDCPLEEFLAAIPDHHKVFAQVIQSSYEGILEDAKRIRALRKDTIIKVPVSKQGLRAIATLHQQGIPVLATAIYHANQAVLAAKCGADYVAPYVNRMCDLELDGVKTTLEIQAALRYANSTCEVVAASFKNLHQVKELLVHGVDSLTIPLDLFEKMINDVHCEAAVAQFADDWKTLCGLDHIA